MLLHVNDAVSLQGARILQRPFIVPYGAHTEYELQVVTGHDNRPVDIESRGCVKWTLTITPSPETPTKVLAYAVFADNIATGNSLRFDFAATSVEMYKHVAGNPATPAVLQLQGFTDDVSPATVIIAFPVALVTSAQQRLPVDLSTALMQELQLAVSVVGAAQRSISKYAGDTTDAAERAEQAAINAHASEVNAQGSATAAGISAGNARESELAAETAQSKAELAQGKAEDAQTAAETAQSKAEDAQAAAETAQGKAEDAQDAASAAQTAAETAQGKAEDAQTAAEAAQTAAETAQGKAEDAQDAAEAAQTAAETAQSKAETAQSKAEDAQAAAETAQGKAEDAQTAAETAQGKAEDAQTAAETAQGLAETAQGKAEDAQTAAETAQQAAETAQGKAEDAQDAAEAAQTAAETAQGKAEDAQTAAETAQGKAEDAQQAAETAQGLAETAQGKAEDAQVAAETAQTAAETAQGKAEDAQDAAEAAQGAAEAAQVAAKGSEDAAVASAKLSESWAKGDTGVRGDEDENNAKYWAEQSRQFSPDNKANKPSPLPEENGHLAEVDTDGNLVTSDLKSSDVAKKDGYYKEMTVGRAENLIDENAPATHRSFGFDSACGDISISDDGNAIVEDFQGTTHVVNQLVKPYENVTNSGIGRVSTQYARGSDALALTMQARSVVLNQDIRQLTEAATSNDVTVTPQADGVLHITGTCTGTTSTILIFGTTQAPRIVGHKYALYLGVDDIAIYGNYGTWHTLPAGSEVWTQTSTLNNSITASIELDKVYDHYVTPQIVDLTVYFNYDQTLIDSITSWDDLVAYDSTFAEYVPYNTGEVKGLTPTVQVVGKNWFTDSKTSVKSANANWWVLNYQLLPNTTYTCSFEAGMDVTGWSQTKKESLCKIAGSTTGYAYPGHAGSITTGSTGVVTISYSPSLCSYYGTGSVISQGWHTALDTYLQMELGSEATAYAPYADEGAYAAPQPLHGLRYSSTAYQYDSYDAVTGKTRRGVGSYTFTGNETFERYQPSQQVSDSIYAYEWAGPSDRRKASGVINAILPGYICLTSNGVVSLVADSTRNMQFGLRDNDVRVFIRNDSCDTPAKMQAALAGKTIYYALASYTEEDGSANTIPLGAGVNTAFQTAGERQATLSLKHEATEYELPLQYRNVYLHRKSDGTEERLAPMTNSIPSTTLHVAGGVDKVINLSLWFWGGTGASAEAMLATVPTITEFYKSYPSWKNYDIPYIEGYLLNYKGTGVQTIGFNAYNHATGTAELLGGNKWQICGTYESVSYVDQWGDSEELELDDQGIFTPVNNGVLTVVGGNGTDTCVHLVWRGYKNYGESDYKWEPYQRNVRELPVILEQFPEGMAGVGTVKDSLTVDSKTVRFHKLVLKGTEVFSLYNTYGVYLNPQPAMKSSQEGTGPGICNIWPSHGNGGPVVNFGSGNGRIYLISVFLYAKVTTVSEFKQWLADRYAAGNPVILMYPLATPVVTTLDTPPNLTYPVNDFGTEQSLPVNTTELLSTDLSAYIKYSLDFTRTVQHYSEIEKDVEELVEEKDHIALDTGDYPKMGAGFARNLVDPNAEGIDRLFSVDTSCGTASITDDGTAIIESMKGRTLNWNQLNVNGAAQNGTTGWDDYGRSPDPDNHIMNLRFAGQPPYSFSGPLGQISTFPYGHIAYLTFWVRTDSVATMNLSLTRTLWSSATADRFDSENITADTTSDATISAANGWKRISLIRRMQNSGGMNAHGLYIINYSSLPTGIRMSFRDCQLFDLTKMFGYGKEPRKIADFRALFPEPFYGYDAGTPMNYKGTGVKTVGFNQYKSTNAFIRVRPQAYQITGTYTSLNYSKWPLYTAPTALTLNQVTVFNTLYSYQNTYYTALVPIEDYSAARTYKVGDVCLHDGAWCAAIVDINTAEEWNAEHWTAIGAEALARTKYFHSHAMATDNEGVFTPPDFGWLYVLGGNDTDTCVHFTWRGYRNGQYEPYWEETRDIDVTAYFPDGMNGVQSGYGATSGYVGDELTNNKATKRIYKKVFTGDESFTMYTAGTGITNKRFDYATGGTILRDNTRGDRYDVFSNYLVAGINISSNSLSAQDKAIANGGCCQWVSVTHASLAMVPPTTWGTITTVEAFKTKLKALYDAGTPLIVWYILKTPVVTPINPAINLSYKVADFGTEAALPPAPASFPVDAVVKYSTDYMRELTHMIEDDVQGRVDALDEEIVNKADKNGDYRKEGLVSNAAGNLIDEFASPVVAQFMFRTTAGDESVAAHSVAEMQACRGTTHTFNQLAEDYHTNTMDVFGEGQVTDAKGGALESNVFQGETIVSNQLVPASVQTTVNGDGVVEVSTAKAGDAHSLVMTAPRSVVVNQLSPLSIAGWSAYNTVTFSVSGTEIDMTVSSDSSSIKGIVSRTAIIGHSYAIYAEIDNASAYDAFVGFRSQGTVRLASSGVAGTSGWVKASTVGVVSASGQFSLYTSNATPSGTTIKYRNVMLVDLTQYFNGDATKIAAIQTWDDLVAHDPRFASYVEYNTGTVAGVQPQVNATGKNLADKSLFSPGNLNADGSYNSASTDWQHTNYIPVKYGSYITASYTNKGGASAYMVFYDADKHFISSMVQGSVYSKTYNVPVGCCYVRDSLRTSDIDTYQLELGSTATAYEPYHDGGTAQAPAPLFAVGNAADEYEAVSGVTTRKIGVVDMGTLDWNYQPTFPRFVCDISDIVYSNGWSNNILCAKYISTQGQPLDKYISQYHSSILIRDTAYTDVTAFKASLSGVYLYYELATPTTSQTTPAQISLQAGSNTLLQTDGGRTAGLTLGYDTTSFNIDLDPARSYYTKLSGAESIQTGLSTLAVDATQDKVMDLTLAYAENRPATVDELKSRYPGVVSLGAYDKGSFVHASGGVWTTGVWNQKMYNGDFSDGTTGWDKSSQVSSWSVSDNVLSYIGSGSVEIRRSVDMSVGHWFIFHIEGKAEQPIAVRIGNNPSTSVASFNIETTGDWQAEDRLITRAGGDSPALRISDAADNVLTQIRNVMLIDLTALCGAGNEPSTVEEAKAYCASIGHDLSEYQAYDAGTPLGGRVDLTGIELKGFYTNRHDQYNAETGKYTQVTQTCTVSTSRIASSDTYVAAASSTYGFLLRSVLPTACSYASYRTNTSLIKDGLEGGNGVPAGIGLWIGSSSSTNVYVVWKSTTANITSILPSGWITDNDPTKPSISGFLAWLSNNPFDVIYRLVTSVTTTIAQQHLILQPGFNAFYQASLGTLAIHNVMTYLGTEWTLKLGSGRKYLYRHDGVDTMLTPSSNTDQPIVSGDKLVDLTWLFGKAANVPATLDGCYALYPHLRGDMPYCASKMLNFTGSALKTVGFNQWDGTYSATGKYLLPDGSEATSADWYISNYVRVVGGLEYELVTSGIAPAICWYDIDKNYISGQAYAAGNDISGIRVTMPDAACWVRFSLDKARVSTACFHLCWDGYHNYGTAGYAYEPYKSSVREMRVTDWFPDGLASEPNSGRYDELTQTKAIKRIYRKVLTGSETWAAPVASGVNRYFSISLTNLGATGVNSRLTGSTVTVSCNIVPTVSAFSDWTRAYSGALYFVNTSTGSLYFMLPYEYHSTVTTVAQLQTFLRNRYNAGDPVIIQWPLATPVETDISEEIPQLSYNYEDFGTEEIIPANEAVPYTSPANLLIVYQKDFTREVANLPENYISKESIADLNAQLGPALGGVISGAYSSAQGKFLFTFTKNATVATLAAATGVNTLAIGMSYIHAPTVDATYTLPTPTDLTQDNTVIVDVTCSNHTITFKDGSDTTLTPQQPIAPATGVKYRFICTYSFSAWKVFALEVT